MKDDITINDDVTLKDSKEDLSASSAESKEDISASSAGLNSEIDKSGDEALHDSLNDANLDEDLDDENPDLYEFDDEDEEEDDEEYDEEDEDDEEYAYNNSFGIGNAPFIYLYNELKLDPYFNDERKTPDEQLEFLKVVKSEICAKFFDYDFSKEIERTVSRNRSERLYQCLLNYKDNENPNISDIAMIFWGARSVPLKRHFFDKLSKQYSKTNDLNQKVTLITSSLENLSKKESSLQRNMFKNVLSFLDDIDTSECYYYASDYIVDKKDYDYNIEESREYAAKVRLGLLLTKDGIPVTYKNLGNEKSKSKLIRPQLDLIDDYGIKKIIIYDEKVLDMSKTEFKLRKGDGYMLTPNIRFENAEFQEFLTTKAGYTPIYDTDLKIKSRVVKRLVKIVEEDGSITPTEVNELQVVFYNTKTVSQNTKKSREAKMARWEERVEEAEAERKWREQGGSRRIQVIDLDDPDDTYIEEDFDEDDDDFYDDMPRKPRRPRDTEFSGYSAIFTSEVNLQAKEVYERYTDIKRDKESLKILKPTIDMNDLRLSDETKIKVNTMIAFTTLVLERIIEYKLINKYLFKRLVESLFSLYVTKLNYDPQFLPPNLIGAYLLGHYNKIVDDIVISLGIPLNLKYWSMDMIKELFTKTRAEFKLLKPTDFRYATKPNPKKGK
ncbi:MAG: hypothetical protein LBF12_06285 [Christensenellaceae bacterium]|jgi:hypothetical protein|nr:hypothetical protein [Christensenellaceae bacterium]